MHHSSFALSVHLWDDLGRRLITTGWHALLPTGSVNIHNSRYTSQQSIYGNLTKAAEKTVSHIIPEHFFFCFQVSIQEKKSPYMPLLMIFLDCPWISSLLHINYVTLLLYWLQVWTVDTIVCIPTLNDTAYYVFWLLVIFNHDRYFIMIPEHTH